MTEVARFAGEDRRIRTTARVDGTVRAPSSKSISNRALVCAALARGESLIRDLLVCEDTAVMIEGLRTLGIPVASEAGLWRIGGCEGHPGPARGPIDAGASGTSARFLAAISALAGGPVVVDGAARMRNRPMAPLLDALEHLGAQVRCFGRPGHLPVEIGGRGVRGGEVPVSGTTSSQFASALLLAGPCMERGLALTVSGEPVSRPYIDTTIEVMQAFGARIGRDGYQRLEARPGGYRPAEFRVPGDWSSAVYFLAAAALTGGRVRVENLWPAPTQADRGVLRHLAAMGCTVAEGPGFAEVHGPGGPSSFRSGLRGIEADLRDLPDAALALAVVAAFASTPTTFTGLTTLPFKETDRLAAVEAELRKIGALVERGPDWIRIVPGARPPGGEGVRIATYGDHRMAMSFAVAGLRIPNLRIADPGCIAKTFPEFFEVLESICGG